MVTMKEVAEAANVSVITVSRVINSPDKVKEETKRRVERSMRELAFVPNHAAKALAENSTRAIHLFVPQYMPISDPFMMKLIAGVSEELSNAYYLFLIRRTLNFKQLCDGVIVMGLRLYEEQKIKEQLNVPFVLFGKSEHDIDCIDIDNVEGAFKITDYIIKKGHRRIGFIMLELDQRFAHERMEGYKKALIKNKIPFEDSLIRLSKDSESDGYYSCMDLVTKEHPSAIFCCNDLIAVGAFRAVYELGLSVPEDISIAGFDSLLYDLLTKVPLTTVRQPVYEAGQKLARRMLQRLKHPELPFEKKLIKPELIIRESVTEKSKLKG